VHFRAELIVYLRRCATRAFSLAQNLGTRSVADGVSTLGLLLVLLLIYYALPVVCTSRYILLAKRSILTLRKYGKDVTLQSRPLGIDTVEVTQP